MPDTIIIPTILASSEQEFCTLTDKVSEFAQYLQIDFTDGSYAPTETVPWNIVKMHRPILPFEADLLVKNPSRYFESVKMAGGEKVICYLDTLDEVEAVIQKAHSLELKFV